MFLTWPRTREALAASIHKVSREASRPADISQRFSSDSLWGLLYKYCTKTTKDSYCQITVFSRAVSYLAVSLRVLQRWFIPSWCLYIGRVPQMLCVREKESVNSQAAWCQNLIYILLRQMRVIIFNHTSLKQVKLLTFFSCLWFRSSHETLQVKKIWLFTE